MAIVNQELLKSIDEALIYNENLVVAASGGPDSQALLSAIAHVGKKRKLRIHAVGINHGLRNEADSELNLVEKLSRDLNISFHKIVVSVKKGASIQAHARDARYSALYEYADFLGSRFITTAHHYDDRAETVLLRLLRGKNIGSLGVLPLISGRIFRPLLKVSKCDLLEYCHRRNLQYAIDPSNGSEKYTRAKIRNQIIPMLEAINPQIKQRLNEIADEAMLHQVKNTFNFNNCCV